MQVVFNILPKLLKLKFPEISENFMERNIFQILLYRTKFPENNKHTNVYVRLLLVKINIEITLEHNRSQQQSQISTLNLIYISEFIKPITDNSILIQKSTDT